MKNKQEKRTKVDLSLTPEERGRFWASIEANGRKAGPWVRTLVLEALDKEERQKAGGAV